MPEFLEIKQVNKVFQLGKEVKVVALKEVSLKIKRGDFVVISGPSGSGKTTLLNIIGGLDKATSGSVILDGQCLSSLGEHELCLTRREHIGFVFQAYNLIPVLSARENIEYVMRLQGSSPRQCDDRVAQIAKKLSIDNLLDKLPNQLSGGQQQRVAVARAVAATPKLLLADEPTANLDSQSAADLLELLQCLNTDEGVTVIFSSHDPLVIAKARHSIVLKDGAVVADVSQR